MSSPQESSSIRRPSVLVLQEDPYPLASKGHGTLSTLIRNRSATSLMHWRGDDEEASGAGAGAGMGALAYDRVTLGSRDEDAEDHRSRVDERRLSAILNGPHMRSMRLIGKNNPRYRWERYWKTEEQLKEMKKPIRRYYERTNYLIQNYLYIDRLLDSSLPHDLLNEYNYMPASAFRGGVEIPETISEESSATPPISVCHSSNSAGHGPGSYSGSGSGSGSNANSEPPHPTRTLLSPNSASPGYGTPGAGEHTPQTLANKKVKRTPQSIYRPTETTPLFAHDPDEDDDLEGGGEPHSHGLHNIPFIEDDDVDSGARIVTLAIYVNFAANTILLAGKIAVIISVPSISVLASLVDAVLDFLSTAIVWFTTWLIAHQDQYSYPVGRRRLEPLGVLVFSVIMVTSFCQVSLEAIQRLAAPDHEIIELGIPAIAIMLSTIVIKGMCWLWCRMVKNSSVQALASDASTDVIFNAGSIAFPIVGFYARLWYMDALGGLLLSMVVIFNWSRTSAQHIKNLCGFSATADQRNVLLYLTMRFAKTIRQIQGLQAYHSGDKLNVEVDIVLDASTSLKDSHDLSESLQYVLESVPIVDRAFVHADYATYNLPTHMQQQG